MKKGLINYVEIENFLPRQAIDYIQNFSKLNYGTLSVDELQINTHLPAIKIAEQWQKAIFGYGVYVMFDNNVPVYVGKADSNFIHRFQSHRQFDGRKDYSFNKLARKAAEIIINDAKAAFDKERFYSEVIPLIEKFEMVRINCLDNGVNEKECDRLERILMKAYEEKGILLYNSVPKIVRGYDTNKTIKNLMS